MEDAYTPLNIFNNKPFDTCYNWNKADILQFLKDVTDDPQTFGVDDAVVKQDLIELKDKIIGLTNFDGPESVYNVPKPKQQALRTQVSGGPGKKPIIVPHPTSEIHWSANNNKERFFLIYDLLGAFLSPITTITTQLEPTKIAKSYYLPLVTLYAKWCIVLSLMPPGVVNPFHPTMAQVTWFEKDQKLHSFFGASMAGYDKGLTDFVKVLMQTRYNYLNAVGLIPSAPIDYTKDYNDSPKRGVGQGDGKGGTRFGNCSETYPFIYVLSGQEALPDKSYGISAELASLFQDNRYNVYNGKPCWETPPNTRASLYAPCDNCEKLLGECHAVLGNFKLFLA